MFFVHPHLDISFEKVWVLGGAFCHHFGYSRAPTARLVGRQGERPRPRQRNKNKSQSGSGRSSYQLPEPITVTLCFLAKGVKADIFARSPSMMAGWVILGVERTEVTRDLNKDKGRGRSRDFKEEFKSIKSKKRDTKSRGKKGERKWR